MTGWRRRSLGWTVVQASPLAIGMVLAFLGSALVGSTVVWIASPPSPSETGGNSASALSSESGLASEVTFPTPIQHVVVIMDENQNYSTVLADGPFEAYLARTYATASNDYSILHGSVPAYRAATSAVASTGTDPNMNLGDLADAAGVSWAAFEESMPKACDKTTDWAVGYDSAHNPFTMYTDITSNTTRCDAHDLTWSSWTSDVSANSIPNYSFLTPNTTDDDHNGTSQKTEIEAGDAWLKSLLSPLINDSAIFSRTAFLITFDEDAGDDANTPIVNGSHGGHIYMVIVSPYSMGLSSSHFYNTYSLLTTAEWLLGLPGGTLGGVGNNGSWVVNPPMQDLFAFKVTFTESGLPSGTSWSVKLNGVTKSSTTSTITFTELDGNYSYTVSTTDTSYSATGGSVTVAGAPLSKSVVFTSTAPAIAVTPSQGPEGSAYTVTGSAFTLLSGATLTFNAVLQAPTSCSDGTFAGTTITTDGSGGFACTFAVPNVPATSYNVVGEDTVTSISTAPQTFEVTTPAVTISPSQGPVGSTYTVTGSGFTVSSGATVGFDAVLQTPTGGSDCSYAGTTITTDSTGGFVCTFAVPNVPATSYNVIGEDTATSTPTAPQAFTVTAGPTITLSPTQGPIGEKVTVSGTGFPASKKLTSLVFDGVTIKGCTSGSMTATATGTLSCTFKVPSGTSGTTVTAKDSDAQTASGSFTVTTPAIKLSVTSGPVGTTVTISGTGFSVSKILASLVFDGVTIKSCTSGSRTTGATGAFSCTFKVPSGTSGTTVTATDAGGQKAVATFKVT